VSVQHLLADSRRSGRHRAETTPDGRIKVAVGVAAAAGALLSTSTQVAMAAPLAPDVAHDVEPAAAPFGLAGLPAEVVGPLAQAEQFIEDLQQQAIPAPPQAVAPPAALPLAGDISSVFGARWGQFHSGVDIADALGTPIRSALAGTVLEAGPASGFGQWIRIGQDDGTTAVYGHINDIYVQEGQRVNAGDVIASVGNRGISTGPHLHLEIWDQDGVKIDPLPWMASKGIVMEQHWGAD
jgi:murein DD-endopeptidase MepM/ murein hydrolase activator NlpD